MASVRCLDEALGFTGYNNDDAAAIPQQGRILRNIVEGADIVMSHILHFYHLAALDYIRTDFDGCLIKDTSPWAPHYNTAGMVGSDGTTTGLANTLIGHYVTALNLRRKAHELAAHISGKQPCQPSFIPGGITSVVTTDLTGKLNALLGTSDISANQTTQLIPFIKNIYREDVMTVARLLSSDLLTGPASAGVGRGCLKYLAYGTFPDQNGANLITGGFLDTSTGDLSAWQTQPFNKWNIKEYIKYSHYDDGGGVGADYDGRHPIEGVTKPKYLKVNTDSTTSYSWGKAPRYVVGGTKHVCEVGPLARVLVNCFAGNAAITGALSTFLTDLGGLSYPTHVPYLRSVLGRHAARVVECDVVARAMTGWIGQLTTTTATGQTYRHRDLPVAATGAGFTEAPRGALSHWIRIGGRKVSSYQAVVPTTWNVSPKDTDGIPGPIETALTGVSVATSADHIKLLRIIHSFDPCIACTVHVVSPDKETVAKFEVPTLIPKL